ncbi:caspase family protein [Streptomyces sp. NPDC004787]|uniref:caspase, EACC1-associated type n=1 Tax=Streptomyces sp. NPDC004787 TaxID=3154291 RepID=UPI0033A5F923
MNIPDPNKTRAILIGVSEYSNLTKLPTVRNNVVALHAILTGSDSWGLPDDHCVTVHDPRTPEELVDPIYHGAEEASDTLLVYYAGHGLRGESRGEFRLTRSGSRMGASHTSTDYNEVREILLNAAAPRKIVVLDCCYAASALGVMSDPASAIAEEALIEGTYLMAAAGETQAAVSDNGAGFTVFTGELVKILRDGIPDSSHKYLNLDLVYSHLHRTLRAKSRPLPHKRERNSLGGLIVSLNKQWIRPQTPPEIRSGEPATPDLTVNSLDGPRGDLWLHARPDGLTGAAQPAVIADAVPVQPGAWPGRLPTPAPAEPSTTPTPTADTAPVRPGAWPGRLPTPAPAEPSTTPTPTADTAPVRPGAWPRTRPTPGAWPDVARIGESKSPLLSAVEELWPSILAEVKTVRRFAWILLSQNAKVAAFDGKSLLLEFTSKNSFRAYRDASVDEVLENVLRGKFNLPWQIKVVNESRKGATAPTTRASTDRKVGQWPDIKGESPLPSSPTGSPDNSSPSRSSGKGFVDWPPVARFNIESRLSRVSEWPDILEEVRGRRRYAWLVLNNHASVIRFDDQAVEIEFGDHATQSNYHNSGVHALLVSVLRDRFGKNYSVRSFAKPSGKDDGTKGADSEMDH